MIPKIIHYCWFGDNPLPELARRCIASWEKYFPDYEIKEWNESNFNLECCNYVIEAYKARKWAFVSDYARFWILYHEGGLYFDTDVEIIKDMTDIISQGAFMGCEASYKCAPGLGLGTEPGLALYKIILDSYQASHFTNMDGSTNYVTVVERVTDILKTYGFMEKDCIQKVAELTVYPKKYFCPIDYETGKLFITENTRSIHWYDASWLDEHMKKRRKRNEKIRNLFPGKIGIQLSRMYMTSSYYWEWISKGQFTTIKRKVSEKLKGNKA